MDNDILAALIAYLGPYLDVQVSSEVPADRPARMVAIGPTGGNLDRFTAQLMYTVDAYAESDLGASQLLNAALERIVWAHESIDAVCRVSVQTTYRSDTDDGIHRWTATVQIVANRY